MSTLGVVVVPAGESGAPLGVLGELLGGRTLLDRAVAALRSCPDVDRVQVVAPGDRPPEVLDEAADVVVLHDASFPLVDARTVGAVLAALRGDPGAAGAAAVLPVTDTLKQVDSEGAVLGTVDRSRLRVAGSPQAYRPHVLPAGALPGGPDAAELTRALVEAGHRVLLVDAPPAAFRVRTELDLLAARALIGEA